MFGPDFAVSTPSPAVVQSVFTTSRKAVHGRAGLPRASALILAVLLLGLTLSSCAPGRHRGGVSAPRESAGLAPSTAGSAPSARSGYAGSVKDNKPSLWISTHPRVVQMANHYRSNITVETALNNGRRYLPTITREFRRRGLPLELAYLPMLESMFENRADSGSARGLWQFTKARRSMWV